MKTDSDIDAIYEELIMRYKPISIYIIKALLNGSIKLNRTKEHYAADKADSPTLDEAVKMFKEYNCIIFTAFRGGYTLEQNLARNAMLKADMQELGLKFRPVTGCYREANWEYPNVEYCFFVNNIDNNEEKAFFHKVFRLSEKYDQDSFLYKQAGINCVAFLVASTNAGRTDLNGDISFAGQLFLGVPDVEAWTDCRDGRFAFQRKGMILIGTRNKKIKCGYGDLFDAESYGANGLVVLRQAEQQNFEESCKNYDGAVPLVQHVFKKEPTQYNLRKVVNQCLKQLCD